MKPIAISLGDPHGVGPEILVRAFPSLPAHIPFVVYGDGEVISRAVGLFAPDLRLRTIQTADEARPGALNVISPGLYGDADLEPGIASAKAGSAALEYIRRATGEGAEGRIAALVTLPVNKEAIRLTAPDFTGHTGYIATLLGNPAHGMLLAGSRLCVSHVSTHCSLMEAIARTRTERISAVIKLTWETLQALGRDRGCLAVAGLNPHAGEGGAFGREEIEQIAPAVEACRALGIPVRGPIPPDSVFHAAVEGRFCGVVAMYHDQGHIPMKTLDFEGGVNITMGLPLIRTSVDHGTAFDIAWKGEASLTSFRTAVDYALRLITSTERKE